MDQRNIDVGQSADGSALVSGDHNHIDQSRTVNYIVNNYGPLPKQPPSQRNDRNEKILLSAVWAEVQDRLNQSLHNAVLLNLGKAEQRHQVSRPWDSQLRIADQASRPLAPETAIVEVFDRKDINGRLLILGNPGAGKTTTMLDLAAALVQRANTDPTQPIPVMFNLSSWQDDKQTLKDWLLSELKLKYGVSPKLGQQWLEAQTLLPLLDGLDELPPHRQEPAVQKINDWLQSGEGASQLLVCSRREEYELYATKLLLNGAICLEPLTDEQLATYFAALGMEPLWHTVRQDPDFLALVRTPLLLSVSILANDAIDPAQWQRLNTPQERLDYLLDAYIQRQLHAPIASRTYPPQKQPTPQQTRHWLTWLAQQLQAQSEDEFLIEKMQPYMLGSEKLKQKYINQAVIVAAMTCGSPLIIPFFLAFLSKPISIKPIIAILTISFVFYMIFSFIFSINFNENEDIKASDAIQYSLLLAASRFYHSFAKPFLIRPCRSTILQFQSSWSENRFLTLTCTLAMIIFYFLIFKLAFRFEILNTGETYTLFDMAISMLILLASWIFYLGFSYEISQQKIVPNQGIFRSLRNSLYASLFVFWIFFVIGLLVGLLGISLNLVDFSEIPFHPVASIPVAVFAYGLFSGFFSLFIFVPIGFLIGGMNACIKHFCLRKLLFQAGYIPWNYARFLNHCTERLLLQRVGGRYRFIHRLVQERFATSGGHRLSPP